MQPVTASTYFFDSFQLFPAQQLLLENGRPCVLGSRAIEILICLIERAGEMVTKQELLDRAWPETFVHEANLRVNVSGLRKALGDGQHGRRFIVNVTGQGYSFVAPVRHLEAEVPQDLRVAGLAPRHNLPALGGRPLGREADLAAVSLHLPARRCVTVAGPGGIGKTTLAVAAAERLLPVYDDGVWFVDLSAIREGALISPTVAQVLGVSVPAGNPIAGLVSYLKDKRLLLVLDNCEHVIDAAAGLVEAVMVGCSEVAVLATSRETLRVGGEWVHWLPPLAVPSAGVPLSIAQALTSPAVRFFVECAASACDGFALTEADVPVVIEICRGLDGLPLAIQLAAARIDMFGLQGLAKVLTDPFLLLSEGRRGALPRQQSLMRTLEWSFDLLSPTEQTVLRRLSVFRGEFTLAGALAIAAGEGVGAEQVYSSVLTLSAKSLLVSDISARTPHPHHRMLHVTRTLLSQKLQDSDERHHIYRRHADFIRNLLAVAESDWEAMERAEWIEIYGRSIEDVRAAIDWAFSSGGDSSLGVVLSATALPLGFQLSLIEEFRGRVERALLHSRRIDPPQLLSEMRLNVAHGVLTHNTSGPAGSSAAAERAIALSQKLDRLVYRSEPLLGLATSQLGAGDYRRTVETAEQARAIGLAAEEPMAVLAAERILAQAHHFSGDHEASERFACHVLDHPAARLPLAYCLTPVDRRVSLLIVRARTAWIQGRLAQADDLIETVLPMARSDGAFSSCPTLAFGAIPIALWNGEDERAAELVATLNEQATRYTLGFWKKWAEGYGAVLRARAGDRDRLTAMAGALPQPETFATFDPDLLTPETAMRAENGAIGWCNAEIRRIQGEWLLADHAHEPAEDLFREAIDCAGRQGALSWELRAATSLGRLWRRVGRDREARELVGGVLSRCDHRRRSADITAAKMLIDNLSTVRPVLSGGFAMQARPVSLPKRG